MNWVRGTGSPWNMHWVQQMDRQEWDLYEDDRTGAMWVVREYGTVLAMLSDGGWRMTKNGAPYRSRYRVFELAGTDVIERTDVLFSGLAHGGHFDERQEGAGRYQAVRRECVEAIERKLQVAVTQS